MAEMLIDSAKFAACNTAEADAIRAKTGGSSPIPYDYENNKGFADAIAAISGSGGNLVARTYSGTVIMSDVASTTLVVPVDIHGALFVDGNYVLSKTGVVSNGEVTYDNEITMHQDTGVIVIAERFTMGSSSYTSPAFKRDDTNYRSARNLSANSTIDRASYSSNGDMYSMYRTVPTSNSISFNSGNASTRYCNTGLYCEYAYQFTAYFVEE